MPRSRNDDRDRRRGGGPPVWAREPRPVRGRGRSTPLTRDDLVGAALAIADADGFEAVSMRNVARRLGVGTMTLYSYVASKDDLLDLVFDELMGELLVPEPLPDDWREAISAIARRTRDVWLRHPWIASSIGERSGFGPNAMRHVEQSLAAVELLGIEGADAFAALGAVDDYALGHAMRRVAEETGRGREADRAVMEAYWADMLASGEFPRIARIAEGAWELDHDERFERGLRWVLDGIAARYER
jgi:AcrR family transcriptional regulator